MNRHLLKGLAWNSLSTGVAQLCGFLRLIVVAAAIGPQGIGEFAIANSVLMAILVLGEMGFKQLYIANRVPSDNGNEQLSKTEILGTIWFGNLILRVILVLVSAIVGVVAAFALHSYSSGMLVVALAASTAVTALVNPQLLEDEREGSFRRIALSDSFGQICGLVSALIAIQFSRSVWILVTSQLIVSCVTVSMSYWLARFPSGLRLNKSLLRKLASHSKPFITIAATTYATYSLDKVILAAFFSPAIVGVYFLAQRIVEVPANLYSLIAGRAVLPFYTARIEKGGADALHRSILMMLAYAIAFYVGIVVVALAAIALFGIHWIPEKWQQSLTLIPLLFVGVAVRTGCHVLSPALIVLGRVHVDARLKTLEAVLYLFLLPIAIYLAGVQGAALAFSAIYLFSLYRRHKAVISPA